MPSTKRGAERTSSPGTTTRSCAAPACGLTVARQLAGTGARVLVLDRYEIGERQTSACAAPTEWLQAMGLGDTIRQTFPELVIHTPHVSKRMRLPFGFSTFDYRELCAELFAGTDADFETAKVEGRAEPLEPAGNRRPDRTDRGDLSAPLVVDCLGWRRVLDLDDGYQPPEAPLSRGLRCIRAAPRRSWRSGSTARTCRLGTAGASPRATRSGRHRLLRPALPRQGADGAPGGGSRQPGGRLPGQLDPPQAATRQRRQRLLRRRLGRALPAADGRGHPHGLLLRDRVGKSCARCWPDGRRASGRWRATPTSPARTGGSSTGCSRPAAVPRMPPRAADARDACDGDAARFTHWAFDHYLEDRASGGSRSLPAPRSRRGSPRWPP